MICTPDVNVFISLFRNNATHARFHGGSVRQSLRFITLQDARTELVNNICFFPLSVPNYKNALENDV